VLASEIGTYSARALHSNHMKSRVWEQYASLTLHERAADPNRKELMKGSGRGYYRNISLLSAWAHAPFMHNNAIGPEICGKPSDPKLDFYASPYVDAQGKPLADPPACLPFDPSAEGRYELYKASMEMLLNPDRRISKMALLDREVVIDVAPQVRIGDLETGLSLRVPEGLPAVALNSLRYKDLMQDLVLSSRDPAKLDAKYQGLLEPDRLAGLKAGLDEMRERLLSREGFMEIDITRAQSEFIQSYYSNVLERIENAGHRFGESLSDREKQALIAFVATL
jgi:hypothetical protein